MGPIIFDISTFIIWFLIVLLTVLMLSYPFLHYGFMLGIVTKKTLSSTRIWRKIHIYISLSLIPHILVLVFSLFLQIIILKHIIYVLVIISVFITCKLIEYFTEKENYQMYLKKREKFVNNYKQRLKGYIYDDEEE